MVNDTILEFFGGLDMIGGTVVSVQQGKNRVIFDFGEVMHPDEDVFDDRLILRKGRIVHDFLRLGRIPQIDGIYQKKDLKGLDEVTSVEEDDRETAVFISHLHLDHMFGIGVIAPEIPVYMTEDAKRLLVCLDTIGEDVPGTRDSFQSCSFGEGIKLGEMYVTPLRLDHDTIGACGLHISTPDGEIVYSGDLRRHGAHQDWTEKFIQKASDIHPDILIMEGTTLRDEESQPDEQIVPMHDIPDMMTEKKLPSIVEEKLKQAEGLVVFNIYHRNVDRIKGMLGAAVSAGRKPVLEMETAYIADQLAGRDDFLLYEPAGNPFDAREGLPQWKQRLLGKYETVGATVINENPSGYFLQNSYHHLLELLDLETNGGLYIHSNGIPLGDYDPGYEKLKRFLKARSIGYVRLGTSGHAIAKHLKYIVDEIDPKILIPLHSFNPDRLKPKNGKQLLPEYGLRYRLKNGGMTLVE